MSARVFTGSRVGFLGRLLGSPLGLSLLAAQFVLLLLFFGWFSERRSSDGCLSCHEDASRMEELGYPQFTVTAAEAQEQSRMPRATCIDCHLGEGGTRDVEEAHQGLLRPFIVGRDGGLVPREGVMPSLLSSRDDPLRALPPPWRGRGNSGQTRRC